MTYGHPMSSIPQWESNNEAHFVTLAHDGTCVTSVRKGEHHVSETAYLSWVGASHENMC